MWTNIFIKNFNFIFIKIYESNSQDYFKIHDELLIEYHENNGYHYNITQPKMRYFKLGQHRLEAEKLLKNRLCLNNPTRNYNLRNSFHTMFRVVPRVLRHFNLNGFADYSYHSKT